MAYIDRLNYKASLFSIIHEYCDFEKQGDSLYLKPFNENMDSMFKELGFVSPVDCKEFCQSWEDNTRAIWKVWFESCPYSGPKTNELVTSFEFRYKRSK